MTRGRWQLLAFGVVYFVAVLVVGMWGPVVAAAGIVGAIVIALLQMRHTSRAVSRAADRLVDAKPRDIPRPSTDNEDDCIPCTAGTWNGSPVWFGSTHGGVTIGAELARWPLELALESGRGVTGDPDFDAVIQIAGGDAWRPVLNADVRARLIKIFDKRWTTAVRDRALVVELPDAYAMSLENILDMAVGIAAVLPDDADPVHDHVFRMLDDEPLAAVRAGHYRWLVAEDWNTPMLLRAASIDRDPDIAAWASAQLAPSTNVFR